MPLPKPRLGEKQNEFVSRCIEFEKEASPDRDDEQIQAMCYEAWRNRNEALGQGRGVGGQRQGIGGAEYCICPKCNFIIKHERNIPCQQIKCHKCGSFMKGTNQKPKESKMTREASSAPWTTVDKTKLPAACFLWVEYPKKKSTWHLPVYMGTGGINPKTGMYRQRGEINLNGLRAALAAVGGARTGKPMNVPASVKAKLNSLAKQYKIGRRGAEESIYKDFSYQISFKEATFVKEDGRPPVIQNVVLLGAESANKRRYTEDCMGNAVSLYEGVQAFVNHPSPDEERMGSRDVMKLAGKYVNVKFSDMKIKADFHGLPNDPASQKYVNVAEHMPDIAGLSQNAQGKVHVEDGIEIVEEITKVFSVDLVTNPATTKGMFEHTKKKGKTKMEYNEITILGLKDQRPDIVEALNLEGQKERDDEVQKLTDERDKAVKEADELKVKEILREKQTLINKLLDESELPDEAKTDVFRKSLLSLKPAKEGETIEAQVKEMIEDRLTAVKVTGVKNNTEKKTIEAKMTAEEAASELKA